ncbi:MULTISPECIES: bifunctional 2-polyprenyl-6-hydroxyphenol methylase/3-demethylubiquinol 3-O-methyltransferase UbiG [unclassified Lentimonas]|uniref:class I SAM-dependent methyltransferase n=1 Tax=unclassified Lentimonas TaxID=2630993 RepID=UPI001321851C|nr:MULTISPECIES: class I SAM-dependent methyltransferase [unclassified Lentimonas]CAA6676544.1 Unannotated [Lentimonas sp. CC4]CAA6685384.1 Unannotated [Lentimonas sp. CC6]CAA7074892.1 Unannotated [Lentimonas sp. CC4]CAA7169517.1 Unannotated [Lentimonas sp. CC21]CAA7182722.1 Unannotated [Lentimonas sp. CC8]
MNINQLANNLTLSHGIWKSGDKSSISYPDDGNTIFFEIEDNSFWFQHRNRCLRKVINHYRPNGMILDIGGGNGYVTKGLIEEGFDVCLMEPGKSGIKNAQRRGIENLICSTFQDAEFKDGVIPAIGLFDVLEHIEDEQALLDELHRSMQNAGKLYLTVPAHQILWAQEDIDAGHYRRYTTESIKNVLEASGFRILHSTYIFSPLPLPIFLFRSLPSRLGLVRNASNADKHKSEHSHKRGLVGKFIDLMLNRELDKIALNKRIGKGSSCLIVAEKL